MTNSSVGQRLVQIGALLLIGNGVMGLVRPRWHTLPWRRGPQLALALTDELADSPTVARPVYLAQAALGAVLMARSCDCCRGE
jgi:hypothetical protein